MDQTLSQSLNTSNSSIANVLQEKMGCFFQNEDVRLEKLREKQGAARAELVEQ
jgi:hypothetical protein